MPAGIPQISPLCPECGAEGSRLTASKRNFGGVRRYRKCKQCGHTFVTQQMPGGSEAVDEKKDAAIPRKLSPADVVELREMAASGLSSYECAAAFDIEQKTAWNVIARRSYKDVA